MKKVATVYYSRDEGWVHILYCSEGDPVPHHSEIRTYNVNEVQAWIFESHKNPGTINVFECKRMSERA